MGINIEGHVRIDNNNFLNCLFCNRDSPCRISSESLLAEMKAETSPLDTYGQLQKEECSH